MAKPVKQLSIFVENQPGRTAEICNILAEHDIDIRALSLADTTNFGIMRLIVNHPSRAESVLKEQGYTVSQTNVIAVGIDDKPGGLAIALNVLRDADIAVEYIYAFVSRSEKTAFVILRVEDNAVAIEALQAKGVRILAGEEIY
ncbi:MULTISPECIES: ACT domain-containing protein [Anaerotruncus]|jgi:hypothetical protein|uniref:ACT domain-containing protein n=1 Tax=Anaerotruncus TaxID=244127 RepID=UPI00082F1898|nr:MULTISPECIES: ACT domain-containing protein [Anaerotruncus]RGX56626.1 ACT domain-containing protein [Anaerotruncus sp. AF02-27]